MWHPIQSIKKALLTRKRRRLAVRMMVYSGVIRHSDSCIRYAMTPKEISLLLHEDDLG